MKQNYLIFSIFYLPLKLNVCHRTLSTRYHYSLGWRDGRIKCTKLVERVVKVRPINKSVSPGYSDLDTLVTPEDKVIQNSKEALYLMFSKLRSAKQSGEGLIPQ